MTRNIRQALPLIAIGLFIALIVINIISGSYGVIGDDSDDKLRLLQIKDFLGGQSWFSTDQLRMGLSAAGTDMHWSRLPDVPILALTYFFDIFMSQDKALEVAISIWPPLTGVMVFWAFAIGAEHIPFNTRRSALRIVTYFLAAFFVMNNFRFNSGAIDHHNLQFVFITLAMVFAMDREKRARRYFLSGLAAAASIAIGPEVYIFVAIICAFIALSWAVHGAQIARAVQAFGIALAIGIGAIFLLTTAPYQYGLIYCDSLSLITLSAAGLGGLGLALIAQACTRYNIAPSFAGRAAALGALAVVCMIVISFQAPQCLANPLDSLPLDVKELWLGTVSEAKPIYDLEENWQLFIPMVMGPVIFALCALLWRLYKDYKRTAHLSGVWSADALVLMLLLSAFLLTIYQVRFAPFAYIFALLALSRWVAQSYQKGLEKGGTNIKYIFWLTLALPIVWIIPSAAVMRVLPSVNSAKADINITTPQLDFNCVSDEILEAFNTLPAGLISTSSNFTGAILLHTKHRVISGNYHRNWQGISAQIEIATSSPQAAYEILTAHNIDYVYHCDIAEGSIMAAHNPQGLTGQLEGGEAIEYLTPAFDTLAGQTKTMLYKVNPARP